MKLHRKGFLKDINQMSFFFFFLFCFSICTQWRGVILTDNTLLHMSRHLVIDKLILYVRCVFLVTKCITQVGATLTG